MALDVCARALLRPGDRVAVEALGYRPAWDALRLAGAVLVPIAVDRDGLDIAALARAHARAPLRALYTTPHHQYPTTVTMSAGRRLALAALAARARLIVLEDDYDHEFHYDGHPVAPLAAADPTGQVIYIGTLSKVLAPGLRLGFAIAPPPVIAAMARWRSAMDRQGDLAMEAAVAELIGDGELERHVRKMRVLYQARRDALVAALTRQLGGAGHRDGAAWRYLAVGRGRARPRPGGVAGGRRRRAASWWRRARATPSTAPSPARCAWCSRLTPRPSSSARSRSWPRPGRALLLPDDLPGLGQGAEPGLPDLRLLGGDGVDQAIDLGLIGVGGHRPRA
jgi:hypothetical protein